MALHYMGNVKHITCQTSKGHRRSPVLDISYNCGEPLKDLDNGKTYYRKHTDGTIILYSDIVCADDTCEYGHNKTTVKERREKMYNDLYNLTKNNSERIYWTAPIALPNSFNDAQMQEAAREIALEISKFLNRPVDYSIHKKPATKRKQANNHIHIAVPEWKWTKGKWGAKGVWLYVNKDGSINYTKQYKDADGNDIRIPYTIDDAEPVYETDPKTGHLVCINQKKDTKGRKQWKMVNIEGLTPDKLKELHNIIDKVNNHILEKYQINDRIKRNNPKTKEILNKAGIEQVHIGKRDAEKQGKSYQEKIYQNKKYDLYRNMIDESLQKQDIAQEYLETVSEKELQADIEKNEINEALVKNRQEIATLEAETADAIDDYIQNELKPEEKFVSAAMNEYKKAITFVHATLAPAQDAMVAGIHAINADIDEYNRKATPTARERLAVNFHVANGHNMEYIHKTTDEVMEHNPVNRMRAAVIGRWNRTAGWHRVNYITRYVSKEAGFLYAKYLRSHNVIKPDEKNDRKIIPPVTCEKSIINILDGGSVPGIKTKLQTGKSASENITAIAAETYAQWTQDATGIYHMPPTDTEVITLCNTLPERMIQLTAMEKHIYYNPIKEDYKPENDLQMYLAQDKELEEAEKKAEEERKAAEAKRKAEEAARLEAERLKNAYDPEEYKRLAAIRSEKLETWREDVVLFIAKKRYQEELGRNENYNTLKTAVNKADRELQDFKKKETEKKEAYENKNAFWKLYEYEYKIDQDKINELEKKLEQAKSKLEKQFPVPPDEADATLIEQEERQRLKKKRADLLFKEAKEAGYQDKKGYFKAYKTAAAVAQEYIKRKPSDPNDPATGKNTRQTQEQKKASEEKRNDTQNRNDNSKKTGRDY